jgi:MFS family permease
VSYLRELKKSILTQRLVILTCLGTLIHWYDFYILSALIPFIINKYFVSFSEKALILTVAGSLIGFLIRPLGAIFLGQYIDLLGRKTFFIKSLNLTALSTFIVAIFPFDFVNPALGLAALMFCRLAQGLALSMEYGSAVSYIYESVPENKTGYFTGLLQTTAPLGFLCSLLCLFISKEIFSLVQFDDWGWRFPLLIGLPLIVLSTRIRLQLPESEEFQNIKNKGEISTSPLHEIFNFSTHRRKMIELIFAIAAPQGVTYYLAHNFSFQQVSRIFSLSSTQQNFLTITVITICWPITIFIGHLSDQISAKKLFKIILLGCLIVYPLCFYFLENWIFPSSNYWISLIPLILIYSLSIALYAPTAKILAESFPTRIRGLGISIPYHIGNGFFGGAISFFSVLQLQNSSGPWMTVIYTMFILLLALTFLSKNKNLQEDISKF